MDEISIGALSLLMKSMGDDPEEATGLLMDPNFDLTNSGLVFKKD